MITIDRTHEDDFKTEPIVKEGKHLHLHEQRRIEHEREQRFQWQYCEVSKNFGNSRALSEAALDRARSVGEESTRKL